MIFGTLWENAGNDANLLVSNKSRYLDEHSYYTAYNIVDSV